MSERGRHGARCFGTDWCSDFPLDHFDPVEPPTGGGITVKRVARLFDRPLHQVSPRMRLAPDGFRFQWEHEATFDGYADGSIAVLPGPDWRGSMPVAFYSTVAATLLAWRGMLPMHMSSVVIEGQAWLIGGAGGAGKSTLTAELIADGAQFLADDLTVLRMTGRTPHVTRGRPAIRLYPGVTTLIDCSETRPVPDDARGKLLACPHRRAPDRDYPLGGIVVLGEAGSVAPEGAEKVKLLARSLFRPRIITCTPAGAKIEQQIVELARTQRVLCLPALQLHDPVQREKRLEQVRALVGEATSR